MTNKRRAAANRARRIVRHAELNKRKKLTEPADPSADNFAIHADWAAGPDEVQEVIANVEEELKGYMGPGRESGVRILTGSGPEKANAMLDELRRGTEDPAVIEKYRGLRAKVREFGGIIVVGFAEGDRP